MRWCRRLFAAGREVAIGRLAVMLAWGMTLLPAAGAEVGTKAGHAGPVASRLSPILRWVRADGSERFGLVSAAGSERDGERSMGIAFLAVVTNQWPAGLVPIFAVERDGQVELRRRPARGQENWTEPLFFAHAPLDEPEAARLSGRWELEATRGETGKQILGWDLALDGAVVTGRFNQDTDYRFAFITGGTFRSNRMELRVEYIADVYLITGEWNGGQMRGRWRHVEDVESGTWEAKREEQAGLPTEGTVDLVEWSRPGQAGRRYGWAGAPPGAGWKRSPRPLCRVWRPDAPPNP